MALGLLGMSWKKAHQRLIPHRYRLRNAGGALALTLLQEQLLYKTSGDRTGKLEPSFSHGF